MTTRQQPNTPPAGGKTGAPAPVSPGKPPHDHTPEEERAIREAALDKTIADSFPASDPPSSDPNPDGEP